MADPTLRPRSTAPVVLTRADGHAADGAPAPPAAPATGGWPLGTILAWVLLGGLVVGLWVLLLAGDSLVVSG